MDVDTRNEFRKAKQIAFTSCADDYVDRSSPFEAHASVSMSDAEAEDRTGRFHVASAESVSPVRFAKKRGKLLEALDGSQ